MPENNDMKLTPKQEVFVHEFVKSGNGTQSALKAYNTTDENTAGVIANENLHKPKIIQVIRDLTKEYKIHAGEAFDLDLRFMRDERVDKRLRREIAKDIQDRAGFGVKKDGINFNFEGETNITFKWKDDVTQKPD